MGERGEIRKEKAKGPVEAPRRPRKRLWRREGWKYPRGPEEALEGLLGAVRGMSGIRDDDSQKFFPRRNLAAILC